MSDLAADRLKELICRADGLRLTARPGDRARGDRSVPFGPNLYVQADAELTNQELVGLRDELSAALVDHDRLLQLEAENRLLTEQVDVLRAALNDQHADESTMESAFDFLPGDVRWAVLKDTHCLLNRGIDQHSIQVELSRLATSSEYGCRIGEGERFVCGLEPYGVIIECDGPLDDVRKMLVRLTVAQLANNHRQREQHELIERVRDLMAVNRTPDELRDAERRAVDKQVSDLIEATVRDSLTRVYNRSKITSVANELDAAGRSYALVIADIDHFKLVNDTHGHLIGDRIIVEVASSLDATRDSEDVIARWGGEEFVALLPKTTVCEAAAKAEQWRVHIERHVAVGDDSVTCSFGVALSDPHAGLDDALQRSDRALYEAKARGRNQVVIDRVESPEACLSSI